MALHPGSSLITECSFPPHPERPLRDSIVRNGKALGSLETLLVYEAMSE